jgi:hypothetical protein
VSRFPAAFRLPAFASRSSDSRHGVRPSSRSAYRPRPDHDGVTAFRTHELRPGWVPPLPRRRRCSPRPSRLLGRRLPLHGGQSLHPAPASHQAGLRITRHQRGFKPFTRPVFPSPVAPDGTGTLGLSPELRTPPAHHRQRTSRWGQAIEHGPGTTLTTSAEPPINVFTHDACDLASHDEIRASVGARLASHRCCICSRAGAMSRPPLHAGSRRRGAEALRFCAKGAESSRAGGVPRLAVPSLWRRDCPGSIPGSKLRATQSNSDRSTPPHTA